MCRGLQSYSAKPLSEKVVLKVFNTIVCVCVFALCIVQNAGEGITEQGSTSEAAVKNAVLLGTVSVPMSSLLTCSSGTETMIS